MSNNKDILIVTGFSGAGMSSSLKHIEDIGYEVFDNFPLSLVPSLIKDSNPDKKPLAIGIDTRSRGFNPDTVLAVTKELGAHLVFLTADENILLKRFSETRRRHPLASDRPASSGIKKEQELLHVLKEAAHDVIDTSMLSIHELRRVLEERFASESAAKLTITLMSFGFKHGTPREADLLMDVRFLQNPYWVPELKPLTGLDKAVGDFIHKDENFEPFIENFKNLIGPLLPCYDHEGKSYLTIAFGCTGGKHRSVFSAETLKPWLEAQGYIIHVFHRDRDR